MSDGLDEPRLGSARIPTRSVGEDVTALADEPEAVARARARGPADASRRSTSRRWRSPSWRSPRPSRCPSRPGEPEPQPDEEAPAEEDELRGCAAAEHAAGELEIPDGYGVIEGEPSGARRSVGIVVGRFNGELTSELLTRALDELERAGRRARGRHGRPGAGRVRAAAGGDGAREDAPLLVHRRARRRDPRRDAALRLRRERGGERAPAGRPRDGRAGRVRRAHLRHRGAGAGAARQGRGGRAHRPRDGRRVRPAARGRGAAPA